MMINAHNLNARVIFGLMTYEIQIGNQTPFKIRLVRIKKAIEIHGSLFAMFGCRIVSVRSHRHSPFSNIPLVQYLSTNIKG
jgi:hypothetical protein